MKTAGFLLLALMLFFYMDFVTEANEEKIPCSRQIQNHCTLEYKPHCGSDGFTYANRCLFCNAVVKSRGVLKLKHHGTCGHIAELYKN
ncbi:ovomucoid-like [Python bivittatus]|uniref:Ovomucoid-like n=1 Tax=Python bivittatus TaxID=176946 RepID=A0A9F3QUK9_PYTBI|nr:ovomucoid-like [Python bivittatus]